MTLSSLADQLGGFFVGELVREEIAELLARFCGDRREGTTVNGKEQCCRSL
jgi:hypothetical protein